MAIITSSSTKATVRRSARQQRKAKHPGQRVDSSTSASTTPNLQASKRRKLRDKDLQSLERCYYACEGQGYDHDSEGQLGYDATGKGNSYWPLEADITDPAVNTDDTLPLLEHPGLESECYKTRSGLEERTDTVIIKRKESRGSLELDILSTESTQTVLLSLPTTPGVTPRVKLPSGNSTSSVDRLVQACSPGDLNDIGIPSPFFYHNLDDGYVPPSSDVPSCWGIPYFEDAYGQDQSRPAFTSHLSPAASQPRPVSEDRRESLGFALGTVAQSRHRAEESCISDESHDSSTHGCPLPCLLDSPDRSDPAASSQCSPSTQFISGYPLDILVDPEWSWAENVVIRRHLHDEAEQPYVFPSGDDDLFYPILPIPAYIRDALAASYSLNNVVLPWANQTASRWDLSNRSMQTLTTPYDHTFVPLETPTAFNHTVPPTADRTIAITDYKDDVDVSSNVHIDMVSQTTMPQCMAVVPARLYQHQFVAWPAPTLVSPPVVKDTIFSDLEGAFNDSENVIKLFDWLVKLNTASPYSGDDQNASKSPSESLTEEVVYQCCEDLATHDSEHRINHCPTSYEALHHDDEAPHYAGYDEEYATTSRYDSAVELLSESKTDDDWADWGTDSEGGSKFDHEHESIKQRNGAPAAKQESGLVETRPSILWGIITE